MSNSILSKLYKGELCPVATLDCSDERYSNTAKEIVAIFEKLKQCIAPVNHHLFEELQQLYSERSCMELEDTFIQGFRLGAKIILEMQNRDISYMGDISVSILGGNADDKDNKVE